MKEREQKMPKKNRRCPLQNECGRACAHVGAEITCDYYKNNAVGEAIIADQERIRQEMEDARVREYEEEMLKEMALEEQASIVMLPVDALFPHPDNPRKKLGDLKELAESIKAKGVMQNLTVVPKKDDYGKYTIIIGHRRHAAAKKAGLEYLPCAIVDMSYQEQLATMLLENIQRSDLTVYEQAKGFQMMIEFGESVSDIVAKTGFSETTVRRRLEVAKLDDKLLEKASGKQISFGDLDKLTKIDDIAERNKVLGYIGTSNFDYNLQRAIDNQETQKAIPIIRQSLLDAGYIRYEGSTQGYDYITSINKNASLENAQKFHKCLTSGVQIYFMESNSGSNFWLYKKSDEAEDEKDVTVRSVEKTEAQLEQERKVREERERREKLVEASARAFKLRKEFISSYSLKQATINLSKIASFLAVLGIDDDIGYSIDKNEFEELLFGRQCEISSFEEMDSMIESSAAAKAVLVTVWLLCDSENEDCYDYYGEYEENEILNKIYEFLESIGYEMSDEERELLDGTSELYKKEQDGE